MTSRFGSLMKSVPRQQPLRSVDPIESNWWVWGVDFFGNCERKVHCWWAMRVLLKIHGNSMNELTERHCWIIRWWRQLLSHLRCSVRIVYAVCKWKISKPLTIQTDDGCCMRSMKFMAIMQFWNGHWSNTTIQFSVAIIARFWMIAATRTAFWWESTEASCNGVRVSTTVVVVDLVLVLYEFSRLRNWIEKIWNFFLKSPHTSTAATICDCLRSLFRDH